MAGKEEVSMSDGMKCAKCGCTFYDEDNCDSITLWTHCMACQNAITAVADYVTQPVQLGWRLLFR